MSWPRAQDLGADKVADEISSFCQLEEVIDESARARRLTYRVIARLLTSRPHDRHLWDARTQFEDTAGYSIGIRWPLPSPEMGQLPANSVWVILRDGEPTAWLWNGWAWTARGERLNLVSRYRTGASVDGLVACLTERAAAISAQPLPAVESQVSEQPIGDWPTPDVI